MTETAPPQDWRQMGLNALARMDLQQMPGFEILFLDSLAAYAMGSGSLKQPYTVEHGSAVVGCLLRAMTDCAYYQPDRHPELGPDVETARERVVVGAHALAAQGWPGLHQLLSRVLSASVGELEIHHGDPERQTRSLFRFGLLAVASGTTNLLSTDAANGIEQLFVAWDGEIGKGFVPPWRLVDSP